jgi:ribonuclease-3
MSAGIAVTLGHSFRRPELLRQALTHRSFAADHNERLEFIGDGILNCAIALLLYQRFPQLPEGDLSRMRANLVNRDTLHRLAVALDLGAALRLGEGELKSGGAARASILADALEAVLGAIMLDAGFDAAYAAIERIYAAELSAANPADLGKDPKTLLQEWLQGRRLPVPEYAIVGVSGEAHLQTFEVVCRIPALKIAASGSGASRRAAEQAAAARAYEQAARA